MSAGYVKGGAWRHGWTWKLWWQVGEWLYGDIGLGRFWLNIGRFSITFDRNAGQEARYVSLSFNWRRGRS